MKPPSHDLTLGIAETHFKSAFQCCHNPFSAGGGREKIKVTQLIFAAANAAMLALAMSGSARADDAPPTIGAPDCKVVNRHPMPNERAAWSGGCRDGMADGEGVLELFSGDKLGMRIAGRLRAGVPEGLLVLDSDLMHIHYEGALVAEYFDGPGTLVQPDRVRLIARFVKGEPEGDVDAVMPDGEHYHGQWKAWHAEGRGEAILRDGTRITGDFHQGQPDGPVVAVLGDGTLRGVWKAGRQSGAIVMDLPRHVHYEGDAQDLNLEGEGVMTYADGAVYRGSWVAGKRQGQGTLTDARGRLVYAGGFRNDHYDGQGRLLCDDGAWYEGTLSDGRRKGHGRMTGPSGVMDGEFSDDPQEFRGVFVELGGRRTEGRWVNWHFEGEMVVTTPELVRRAVYHGGQLDGASDSRFASGVHVTETYLAGVLEGAFREEWPDGSSTRGQYRAGLKDGDWESIDGAGRISHAQFLHGDDVTPVPDPRAVQGASLAS